MTGDLKLFYTVDLLVEAKLMVSRGKINQNLLLVVTIMLSFGQMVKEKWDNSNLPKVKVKYALPILEITTFQVVEWATFLFGQATKVQKS